jgi:hypothetical protein
MVTRLIFLLSLCLRMICLLKPPTCFIPIDEARPVPPGGATRLFQVDDLKLSRSPAIRKRNSAQ